MNAITIVLRSGMGMLLDSVRPYLKPGMPIAIGRAGAVIAEVAEGNAIEDKRLAAEAAAGYIDSVERYVEGANTLESVVAGLENTLLNIERHAEAGQNGSALQAMDALRRIRELTAAFLDNSGARAERGSPASGAAAEPAYPGAAAARRPVNPGEQSRFTPLGNGQQTGRQQEEEHQLRLHAARYEWLRDAALDTGSANVPMVRIGMGDPLQGAALDMALNEAMSNWPIHDDDYYYAHDFEKDARDAADFAQKLEQHLSGRAEALYAEKVVPLRPSIFDVITGTAGATGDGSGAQLPPLDKHLAQVEQVAAGLREDQAELAQSILVLEDWLERVEIEDGYVGVPVIEAVEVVVTELKRQQQVIHPVACRYGHWFAGDSDEAAFVRERGICRDCADVDEQLTGQVLLKPCSFCGGPPKPIVTHADHPFGAAPRMSDYGDDGLWVEACVFCHECGAQGPALQRNISDASDYDSVLEDAVDLWQNRDERHAELYQAGHAEGLNLFPRPDIEPAPQVLCAGVDVATDRVELAIHNWTAPAEGGDA